MSEHPLRNAPLHVWAPLDRGAPYIARFAPYSTWLIFFEGASAGEASKKANAWRDEPIAKHESAYLARLKAREAARAKREAGAAE